MSPSVYPTYRIVFEFVYIIRTCIYLDRPRRKRKGCHFPTTLRPRLSMIIRVNVVLKKTVVDSDSDVSITCAVIIF